MQIYYFLPVVLIAMVLGYSILARRRLQSMSPDEAAEHFSAANAAYFDLQGDEKIVGVWSGLEFQGAQGAARQLAGAALNSLAANAVGVSTYIPTVQVGMTSAGRVLVSREYSELGQRGNYSQIAAFAAGTRAVPAPVAHPNVDLGHVPRNPYNPSVALEFVQLRAPTGEVYEAWMSPQGAQVGQAQFRSILAALG